MAESESNLKVKLFVTLKNKFPNISEYLVQNVMKQFSNDEQKCVEALMNRLSNSMMNLNIESRNGSTASPKSYSSNAIISPTANIPWSFRKNIPSAHHTPESVIDLDKYVNPLASNSSKIPHINCITSEPSSSPSPGRQIAVQHIQTKPNSSCTRMYNQSQPCGCGSCSVSPFGDKIRHWPTVSRQTSKEVLNMPNPTITQHLTQANFFIDGPSRNLTNHTAMNAGGGIIDYDLQNPGTRPTLVHTISHQSGGGHSPQQIIHSSQPGSPYSPQSGCSGPGSHSPQIGGQSYISSKPTSSNQISRTFELHPMSDNQTKYQYTNIHGVNSPSYPSESSPHNNIGMTSNTSTIKFYQPRPGNNTLIRNVSTTVVPTVSTQSDNLPVIHPRSGGLQEDPDYTNALLDHQRKRFEKLNEDYNKLIMKSQELTAEIEKLEQSKKNRRFPTDSDVLKMRNTTATLRFEIACMTKELDTYNNGLTPIGVLDPLEQQNFYKNMNTGQSGSIFAQPPKPQEPTPPPLPPRCTVTSRPIHTPPVNDYEGEPWNCPKCTFLNNPAMDKCEMCEIPRSYRAKQNPASGSSVLQ